MPQQAPVPGDEQVDFRTVDLRAANELRAHLAACGLNGGDGRIEPSLRSGGEIVVLHGLGFPRQLVFEQQPNLHLAGGAEQRFARGEAEVGTIGAFWCH